MAHETSPRIEAAQSDVEVFIDALNKDFDDIEAGRVDANVETVTSIYAER